MKFYTNGKLMMSGEYTVLRGAKALAIPTYGYGQSLEIDNTKNPYHLWQSFENINSIKNQWFEAKFSIDLLEIIETNDIEKAKNVQKALKIIQNKKDFLFHKPKHFTSILNYNRNWGLGSSSSFLVNLQKWSKISAFEMNDALFKGGSNYDVAVCLENQPLIYQLDFEIEEEKNKDSRLEYTATSPQKTWALADPFTNYTDQIWFVYLNKKQSTSTEIKSFKSIKTNRETIDEISQITIEMEKAENIETLNKLIDRHETIVSKLLQRPKVKQSLFPDFKGSIKSLGAWGGDFVLATGTRENVNEYFSKKSFKTMFSYYDLFLNHTSI